MCLTGFYLVLRVDSPGQTQHFLFLHFILCHFEKTFA